MRLYSRGLLDRIQALPPEEALRRVNLVYNSRR